MKRNDARDAIRRTINEQLARDPRLRSDLDKLFGLVARSYDGPRKGEAWHRFRVALKAARIELAERPVGGKDIDRPCPACRAKAGEPCHSVGENDNLAPEFMAASGQHNAIRGNKAPGRIQKTLKQAVMHPQRRDPNAPMTGVVSAA